MTVESGVSYATVSMGLRPPRVVAVFDVGVHWHHRARRALYAAGRVWGGAGFALVPHRDGRVDQRLLRACRAYDPDFVVTVSMPLGELERLSPGSVRVNRGDGELLSGAEHEQWVAENQSLPLRTQGDQVARDVVAAVCSPYRVRLDDDWDEDEDELHDDGGRVLQSALSVSGTFPGSEGVMSPDQLVVAACPPGWGGSVGLLVADHVGLVESPDVDAAEPVMEGRTLERLLSWMWGGFDTAAPEELVWSPPEGPTVRMDRLPTAWTRSMAGLVEVSSFGRQRTGVVVVGDEPEDFALARLWRLTYGFAAWLPTSLVDRDVDDLRMIGLSGVVFRTRRQGGGLRVVSTSLPPERVTSACDRLFRDTAWAAMKVTAAGDSDADGGAATRVASVCSVEELPWEQRSRTHLGVAEQFDQHVTMPVTLSETGTRTMAAPLPAPMLDSRHVVGPSDLVWHVDIGWPEATTVHGRGLDGHEVFSPETTPWLTWGRASRHGVTYQSQRFDFVAAGIPAVNRLARPAVRDLGLADWVQAKSREHGLEVRISDAGQRSALLARMLGGRRQFLDLFAGPLLDAMRGMRPTSATSSHAYPHRDGVALSSEQGVLTFGGLCARMPDTSREQARALADTALRAGVLRRGLVLGCAVCEEVQFQPLERLGQTWTCLRCDATGQLDLAAWRMPVDEPTWFYDLHPVARHLLRDHGEVSVLLSAYLASQAPKLPRAVFQDVEELEFALQGTPKVEVDLITYNDDVLTVAECKSTDHLAGGKAKAQAEVAKKCQAGEWLRADQLLFATTAPSWSEATRKVIRGGVRTYPWGPLGAPEVRLVTGLGTSEVRDERLL